MKAKVRTFNGTTSPEVTQRETDHRKLAREAAAEGFVLLENKDHFLPLAKGSKVAATGSARRAVFTEQVRSAPSKEAPVPAMSMSVTALIFSRA